MSACEERDPPPSGWPNRVDAPALAEAAAIRWDVEGTPAVGWDDGTHYVLVHPTDPRHHLTLARFAQPPDDPSAVAIALAETLAACDFPPTDRHAAPGRVAAALRAARVDHPALLAPRD